MAKEGTYVEDEVSLKSVILTLQEYFWYLLRNWFWIMIPVVIFVGIKVYQTKTTPVSYKAHLTFILNDNYNNASGLSGLLGNFGIGGSNTGFTPYTLIEMATSLKLVQRVLLQKVEIKDTLDYFANHLIRQYKYHEKWEEDGIDDYRNFKFLHDSTDLFNPVEWGALKTLHGKVIGLGDQKRLIIFYYDDDTSIITLTAETSSHEMSLKLANAFYDELKSFYITKTTQQQIQTFDLVTHKADSLRSLLRQMEYSLAAFEDQNRNLWTKKDRLDKARLTREVNIISLMYGETVKNLEIADFALKNALPSIESIDRPYPPIPPSRPSLLINIIFGILMGGILGTGVLIGVKIYRDIMKS